MQNRIIKLDPSREIHVSGFEIVDEDSGYFPQVPALSKPVRDKVVRAKKSLPDCFYSTGAC